jgi:hypothetical protein
VRRGIRGRGGLEGGLKCASCVFLAGILGGGVEVGGIVVELEEVCYVSKARYTNWRCNLHHPFFNVCFRKKKS